MKKKMPDILFRIMAHIALPIRNLLMPPDKIFAEIKIEPGYQILDYGCGPGIFTIMAAEKTGPSGKVYALDIHPLAVKMVEQKAQKNRLANIKTILSNCPTSIPDGSLDLVILFDVFHLIDNQEEVLVELHRVLNPEATLCFSDHHMKEGQILSKLHKDGLFKLKKKGERTFSFSKKKT